MTWRSFFLINVPARDGRLRGPVAVLLGISTTRGRPSGHPGMEFTRRVENTNETDALSVGEVDSG